jgi:hypothetical protein
MAGTVALARMTAPPDSTALADTIDQYGLSQQGRDAIHDFVTNHPRTIVGVMVADEKEKIVCAYPNNEKLTGDKIDIGWIRKSVRLKPIQFGRWGMEFDNESGDAEMRYVPNRGLKIIVFEKSRLPFRLWWMTGSRSSDFWVGRLPNGGFNTPRKDPPVKSVAEALARYGLGPETKQAIRKLTEGYPGFRGVLVRNASDRILYAFPNDAALRGRKYQDLSFPPDFDLTRRNMKLLGDAWGWSGAMIGGGATYGFSSDDPKTGETLRISIFTTGSQHRVMITWMDRWHDAGWSANYRNPAPQAIEHYSLKTSLTGIPAYIRQNDKVLGLLILDMSGSVVYGYPNGEALKGETVPIFSLLSTHNPHREAEFGSISTPEEDERFDALLRNAWGKRIDSLVQYDLACVTDGPKGRSLFVATFLKGHSH